MSSPQNIVDPDGEPQESLLELFFGVLRECRDLLCCWKRSKSPRKPSLAPRDIRPVGKAVTVRKPSGKSLEVSDKGSTISPDSTSRLQALVIGIDHYRSNGIKDLEGAVKDADKISKYLCTHLGVPSAQIVNLRNGAATRKAIVRELKALPKRKGACEGDPFFIFFAGHGTTAAAPDGWITSTKDISMIVPHDGTANGKDDQGNEHNIPDRTIGALLNQLSESKGGNITVIFDCCHSGSGTRGDIEGPEYDTGESEEDDSPSDSDLDDDVPERPRGFEMEDSDSYTLPRDIDETIWSETFQRCRGAVEQVGFAMSGTKSHVLLAACREGERAFERGSSGAFTTALLKVLERQPANSMPQLTYHNLMARVKASLKRQHPQCEGYYSNRSMFSTPSEIRHPYLVTREPAAEATGTSDSYRLDAGSAHGIARDALFSIYTSEAVDSAEPVATMVAAKVRTFYSDLSPQPPTARLRVARDLSTLYAVQISMGRVRSIHVHVPEEDPRVTGILDTLRRWSGSTAHTCCNRSVYGCPSITLTESDDKAQLSTIYNDGKIHYTLHSAKLIPAAFERRHELAQPTDATAKAMHTVMCAASTFFWHLTRKPKPKSHLRSKLNVQAFECKREDPDSTDDDTDDDAGADDSSESDTDNLKGATCDAGALHVLYTVDERKNLLTTSKDLNKLEVVADRKTTYGIKIENSWPIDLHVYAFFFDFSNLSISKYYTPPSGTDCEASLPANSALLIGYGAAGGQPYTFYVPHKDRDVDIAVIRLFISTRPIDLSGMVQESVFEDMTPRSVEGVSPEMKTLWDTVDITVVQRKPA